MAPVDSRIIDPMHSSLQSGVRQLRTYIHPLYLAWALESDIGQTRGSILCLNLYCRSGCRSLWAERKSREDLGANLDFQSLFERVHSVLLTSSPRALQCNWMPTRSDDYYRSAKCKSFATPRRLHPADYWAEVLSDESLNIGFSIWKPHRVIDHAFGIYWRDQQPFCYNPLVRIALRGMI